MRLLHTMLRVGNLDQSIAFYTEILGMQLLRRQDYPDGRFTLAFVGYGRRRSLRRDQGPRRQSDPRSRPDEARQDGDRLCRRS